GYFDVHARRIWLAVAGEVFGVEFVVDRKIFLHVGQENRYIDDVIPTGARVLEHEADIFKHRAALLLDVVSRDVAALIEGDAGNFLGSALTRPDSGKKKQIPDALRMRKRAHRLRRPRASD